MNKGKQGETPSVDSADHRASVVSADLRAFMTNSDKAVEEAPRSVIFSKNSINFSEEGNKGVRAEAKADK